MFARQVCRTLSTFSGNSLSLQETIKAIQNLDTDRFAVVQQNIRAEEEIKDCQISIDLKRTEIDKIVVMNTKNNLTAVAIPAIGIAQFPFVYMFVDLLPTDSLSGFILGAGTMIVSTLGGFCSLIVPFAYLSEAKPHSEVMRKKETLDYFETTLKAKKTQN